MVIKKLAGIFAGLALVTTMVSVSAPAEASDVNCRSTIKGRVIDGNINVPRDAKCTLSGVTVKGDVKVQRGATAYVTGKSRVHGNVQAEGQRHVSVMSYSRVNGDVQAKEGNGAYVGGGVFVGGNVQMEKNRGKVTTISSTIDGDVQYFSNYSSTGAAKQISSNRINGNLQCKSNRPAPTGGKNIVKGNKEDQCRRL